MTRQELLQRFYHKGLIKVELVTPPADLTAPTNGSATANGVNGGGGGTPPVRPSAGTPDMSRYTPTSVDAMASARDRWMNTCSGLSSASAVAAAASQPQLQQATSPHQTFYPWMAIAGEYCIQYLFTLKQPFIESMTMISSINLKITRT